MPRIQAAMPDWSSSVVENVPEQPKKAPSKTTVACNCTVASVACNGTMAEFVWQQVSCPLAHRRPDDPKEIVFSTLGQRGGRTCVLSMAWGHAQGRDNAFRLDYIY